MPKEIFNGKRRDSRSRFKTEGGVGRHTRGQARSKPTSKLKLSRGDRAAVKKRGLLTVVLEQQRSKCGKHLRGASSELQKTGLRGSKLSSR